jgi:hypothetical protein
MTLRGNNSRKLGRERHYRGCCGDGLSNGWFVVGTCSNGWFLVRICSNGWFRVGACSNGWFLVCACSNGCLGTGPFSDSVAPITR